jgi:hypothetical protein
MHCIMTGGLLTLSDRSEYLPLLNAWPLGNGCRTCSRSMIVKINSSGNGPVTISIRRLQPTEHSSFRRCSIPGAKELCKTVVPPRCKFFIWLALLGRCWTSDRLQRHQLQNNGPCALCSQANETIDHLTISCVFSKEVWFRLLRVAGFQYLTPTDAPSLVDWWLPSRKQVHKT